MVIALGRLRPLLLHIDFSLSPLPLLSVCYGNSSFQCLLSIAFPREESSHGFALVPDLLLLRTELYSVWLLVWTVGRESGLSGREGFIFTPSEGAHHVASFFVFTLDLFEGGTVSFSLEYGGWLLVKGLSWNLRVSLFSKLLYRLILSFMPNLLLMPIYTMSLTHLIPSDAGRRDHLLLPHESHLFILYPLQSLRLLHL